MQLEHLEGTHSDEVNCAHDIVRVLFNRTNLTQIAHANPKVIVGLGNWISFTVEAALSLDEILNLQTPSGARPFVPDFWRRSAARSRTTPSLHLTNIGAGSTAGRTLTGHVDAFYWPFHPLRHALEFFSAKTLLPSLLWRRMAEIKQGPSANPVFSRQEKSHKSAA